MKTRIIKRDLFRSFLIDVFINHAGSSLEIPDNLPKKITEQENGTWQCFFRGQKGAKVQLADAKVIVMQMCVSGILNVDVKFVEPGNQIILTTSLAKTNGEYKLLMDSFWNRIKFV